MRDFFDGRLRILQGDITKLKIDAVVNAANSSLMGGGGVDGAIHRAGGGAILKECKKIRETEYPEGLPPGRAVLTTGGNLPASHIIHTVGPVWHGGTQDEEAVLAAAYTNSLLLAEEHGFETVAFPAISTGVYGYPKDKAAKTSFKAVEQFIAGHGKPKQIIFVFFSGGDLDLFIQSVT